MVLRKPSEDWHAPILETDIRAQCGGQRKEASEANPECGVRLHWQKRACTAGDTHQSTSALWFLSFYPFLLEGWTLPGARQWHLSHCLSMSPTDVQILGFRAWIPRPDRIATRLAPVILPRATFPPVSWLSDYFRDVVLTRATCDSASQTP